MGDRATNAARLLAENGHATPELVEMLSAEVDRLSLENARLIGAEKAREATIEHLRAQKFHARRIMAALLDPNRYVIEVDRETAIKSGQIGAVK